MEVAEQTVQPVSGEAAPNQSVTDSIKTYQTGDCSVVNNYDWPIDIAYAVCMAESGGNANASNLNDHHGTCIGSYGLMQIACIHGGIFYDPQQNMQKAYEIYQRSGWKPWGAYTSGAYLKYL